MAKKHVRSFISPPTSKEVPIKGDRSKHIMFKRMTGIQVRSTNKRCRAEVPVLERSCRRVRSSRSDWDP